MLGRGAKGTALRSPTSIAMASSTSRPTTAGRHQGISGRAWFCGKGNENHWLQVNLRAEKAETNATAVGARVTVHADGMVQTKELQAGGQFGATNSFTLHFGLAQAKKVDRIVVRWPNRDHQETVLVDVDIDQRIEVFEAEGRYEVAFCRPIPTRSFPDSHPTAGR